MTINPYLRGGAMVLSRLFWDLHPSAWISRKRLKTWRNRHRGEKAVILCNGPSLNNVDFRLLKRSKIFTFGLNKINLLFERTDFRPSVVVVGNSHVLQQNADFYNTTSIPLFLDSAGRKWIRFRQNIQFLHKTSATGKFAGDCSLSINPGYTVTYLALQLAFHIGFQKVALVGCDHTFTTKGPANETIASGTVDPNHFDPNYFVGGQLWQLPDLTMSELHYSIAGEFFKNYQRKIVNCTVGGQLEVFERQEFLHFLQNDG